MEYFKIHNLRQWTHRFYMAYHFPLFILNRLGFISEQAFRKPWPAHLGWYLRGYSIEEANQIWDWVAETQVSKNWRTDTCQILKHHLEQGDLTFLISGTPEPLLARLACELNADHVVGTGLEINEGRFTGRNSTPACIGDNKVPLTQNYLRNKQIEINWLESYAYADSLSDRFLLAEVGHPIATYPDEGLHQLAAEHGWQIFPGQ